MIIQTGYPFWQFSINKWNYGNTTSWRHGNAYLPWIKIIW